jgi:outer membrane receptor for ferrienterochelin and colicin
VVSRFTLCTLVGCTIACGLPGIASAQLQQGTIQGTVVGPDGSPLDGATVTLLDSLGDPLASTVSQSGKFRLSSIAPGTYALRADAPPLHALVQTLTVRGALPIQISLRLSPTAAEQVIVRPDLESGATATGVTLGGDALRRAAVRIRSRALQNAIATAPGWATEDNGLLHVRGVDDGVLYVIDGVPVYERLDGLFGTAPDPAMIESVNIVTGYVAPEFGFKAGGVIEVRSIGRRAESWLGTVDAGGGSSTTRDLSTVVGGPLSAATALTLGVSAEASSRFLDPVHPDNLHNDGGALSGGGQFAWNLSPSSQLTAVAGFGRSRFDVPHGEEQDEAGQDQRQRINSYWQSVSWQRLWSANTISQISGYHRLGSAALVGSAGDTPLFTHADRSLRRIGALASLTHHVGRHVVKVGAEAARLSLREDFTFAVTDAEEGEEAGLSDGALAFTPERPFVFAERAQPTLYSIYFQDSLRATSRLTVDVGVRADWSRMLARASQWSPRLGAAYQFPSRSTTIRGSFARFYQPPQPENLLLASSDAARALSPFVDESHPGGADLSPERQTAFDVSVNQALGRRLRADVSYWRRRVRNAADPNVFFGTTLIFPNSVDTGRASGVDVRLEMPRVNGWSSHVSYAHARVVQYGPINGGLFLEDEAIEIGPGTAFTPDHDQRHVASFAVSHDLARSGFSWSLAGRYESGTPLEVDDDEIDELQERPGANLVDFDRGRVKPRTVIDLSVSQRLLRSRRVDLDLRFALLNLTDERWAYNFGNPFSGTHFGHGRSVRAGLRASFR